MPSQKNQGNERRGHETENKSQRNKGEKNGSLWTSRRRLVQAVVAVLLHRCEIAAAGFQPRGQRHFEGEPRSLGSSGVTGISPSKAAIEWETATFGGSKKGNGGRLVGKLVWHWNPRSKNRRVRSVAKTSDAPPRFTGCIQDRPMQPSNCGFLCRVELSAAPLGQRNQVLAIPAMIRAVTQEKTSPEGRLHLREINSQKCQCVLISCRS